MLQCVQIKQVLSANIQMYCLLNAHSYKHLQLHSWQQSLHMIAKAVFRVATHHKDLGESGNNNGQWPPFVLTISWYISQIWRGDRHNRMDGMKWYQMLHDVQMSGRIMYEMLVHLHQLTSYRWHLVHRVSWRWH